MWQFDILTNKFVPGSLPANGKITACYTRLSQDDDSSNWYTGKSL